MEVSRGMEEKFTRGEPTVFAPFGYRMENKKWVIEEESAEIVREIFRRYAEGEGERAIAIDLGNRGVRTMRGNIPENRWVDYMLNNPAYIGMLRRSTAGTRAIANRYFAGEEVMTIKGVHEPIISMDLWNAVQDRIVKTKNSYPKYSKREQFVDYMLKGLVRCSSCGGTLAMSAATSGKSKTKTMQCCNYSRGSCKVSHSITIPKLEKNLIDGLEKAMRTKDFTFMPTHTKKTEAVTADYNKLIAVEERKLEKARQAYLSEIDTLEQYAQIKKDITERINALIAKRDEVIPKKEVDLDKFSKKVYEITEFIKRDDVTAVAKNEALRTLVGKIVYEKADGNLAIYFRSL
jgi:hypothetical protein